MKLNNWTSQIFGSPRAPKLEAEKDMAKYRSMLEELRSIRDCTASDDKMSLQIFIINVCQ